MTDAMDMSVPVTRRELVEELAKELAKLESKVDHKFEIWGGALLARIADSERRLEARIVDRLEVRIADSERRLEARIVDRLEVRIADSERRLAEELTRHCSAMQEAMLKQIAVIEEKYSDLPRRVRRVEAKVFPRRRP